MKTIIYLFTGLAICFMAVQDLHAQEVDNPQEEFIDKEWFLTKLIMNDEEIPFISNEEVEQSLLIIEDFWSSDDDEVLAHIVYCDYQSVDIYFKDTDYNEFYLSAFTIWAKLFNTGCTNDSNSYFQSILLYEFWNNNELYLGHDYAYPFHFSYTINQLEEHQKLIVINDNGDETHYQSIPYLSVKNQQKSNLTLYPNPVKDYLYIENLAENVQLAIYDLSRKILKQLEISSSTESIDVSQLSKGLYFYRIQQNGRGIKSGKLVKE